ncbi:MAG: PP2C family protein-serine/threonine phosphatase [Acidobacteria bacterium]|nr:PP2C family protein-serine/threonine phosphatase [Acidobacteriota bacterium]
MPRSAQQRVREFFDIYTQGFTSEELRRLFTRETRDAYRFFARGIDRDALSGLSWPKRALVHLRLLFLAFSLKLSPARRVLYGVALFFAIVGMLKLFRGFASVSVPAGGAVINVPLPAPQWADGTLALLIGFVLLNLIVLLEVADRLSLKNDLDIAREIQQAMLPGGMYVAQGVEAYGLTRPANTVGGDFYDILPLADDRLVIAVGDVAGKGSPAALLMALLLAMLRTLLDAGLEDAALVERLNVQISRHAPVSRFITLFVGTYEPATRRLTYVNAGHMPPLLRRGDGGVERLVGGGVALGMFDASRYESGVTELGPTDLLVLYSDGITEAENPAGQPFDEAGLDGLLGSVGSLGLRDIATAVLDAVQKHAQDTRFADDLTLVLLRPVPVARPAA